MGKPSQSVPTLTFNYDNKDYSIVRVDESQGVVFASRFHYNQRMRGRPRRIPIAKMGPVTIRRIKRSGK